MKLHEKIKLMRTVKGWSQEETAEKINMSLNAYGCIERGETCPNLRRLEQIAKMFGVEMEELVSDKGVLNIGMNSSDFNKWYSNPTSEQLIELQIKLEKAYLEIEYLKQQNTDLREIIHL